MYNRCIGVAPATLSAFCNRTDLLHPVASEEELLFSSLLSLWCCCVFCLFCYPLILNENANIDSGQISQCLFGLSV